MVPLNNKCKAFWISGHEYELLLQVWNEDEIQQRGKNQNEIRLKPCFHELPATKQFETARPEPDYAERVPVFNRMKYEMNCLGNQWEIQIVS